MPRLLVELLRDAGHDVAWTVEDAAGDKDRALLTRSASEDRVLISKDYDFGDLAFAERLPAVGIVVAALGSNARKE